MNHKMSGVALSCVKFEVVIALVINYRKDAILDRTVALGFFKLHFLKNVSMILLATDLNDLCLILRLNFLSNVLFFAPNLNIEYASELFWSIIVRRAYKADFLAKLGNLSLNYQATEPICLNFLLVIY